MGKNTDLCHAYIYTLNFFKKYIQITGIINIFSMISHLQHRDVFGLVFCYKRL